MFIRHKQKSREDRGLTIENRECKPETWFGCEAKFRVHIDIWVCLTYATLYIDSII
jgi:hypothetical protein